jgi:hypothetical protein
LTLPVHPPARSRQPDPHGVRAQGRSAIQQRSLSAPLFAGRLGSQRGEPHLVARPELPEPGKVRNRHHAEHRVAADRRPVDEHDDRSDARRAAAGPRRAERVRHDLGAGPQ